jgi:CO dehydrogenase nickel-insertion accessory protein CooC1
MTTNLIYRVKHLQEFIIDTEISEEFRFNGVIPYDMKIVGNNLEAKVWAIDFDEAVQRLNEFLETCK